MALIVQDKAWPADKVERWPTDKLVPSAHNARVHSAAQVTQLAAAITQWGWTSPVLVDEDGGLIAGHGRVLAAQQLGLPDIPVMVAVGWTDEQKRAYAIAENKIASNSAWDAELLSLELSDLRGTGFDLNLTGFDSIEVNELIESHAKIKEASEPLKPKKFMRVLVSIPVDSALQAKEALDMLARTAGIEIDYGAN